MSTSSKEPSKEKTKPTPEKEVVIKLKKPITSLGKTFTELRLREPNGEEFRELGMPISGEGKKTKMDTAIAMDYVEKICGLSEGDSKLLCLKDSVECTLAIVAFFTDSMGEEN